MYIDTLESVMSQSSKVMIDVEGGNNMMYLPLDKLVPGGGNSATPGSAVNRGLSSQQLREVTDAVTEQLRRDLGSRNGRGGR